MLVFWKQSLRWQNFQSAKQQVTNRRQLLVHVFVLPDLGDYDSSRNLIHSLLCSCLPRLLYRRLLVTLRWLLKHLFGSNKACIFSQDCLYLRSIHTACEIQDQWIEYVNGINNITHQPISITFFILFSFEITPFLSFWSQTKKQKKEANKEAKKQSEIRK